MEGMRDASIYFFFVHVEGLVTSVVQLYFVRMFWGPY